MQWETDKQNQPIHKTLANTLNELWDTKFIFHNLRLWKDKERIFITELKYRRGKLKYITAILNVRRDAIYDIILAICAKISAYCIVSVANDFEEKNKVQLKLIWEGWFQSLWNAHI